MPDAANSAENDADTVGEHVQRHRDGTIWAKGPTLGGQSHGYWEWWRRDGTLMRSGTFDRGAQVGEWVTYDRGGAPHKVTRMTGRTPGD